MSAATHDIIEARKASPRGSNHRGHDTGKLVPMQDDLTPEHYWAAGFLEGEGSFFADPKGYLHVTAAQKQRQPLEQMLAVLGGRIYRNPKRTIYTWHQSSDERAEATMILLRPLMSPRRQWQIDRALKSAKEARAIRPGTGSHQRVKETCPNGHSYNKIRRNPDGSFRGRECTTCRNERRRIRYQTDPEYREKIKADVAARRKELANG